MIARYSLNSLPIAIPKGHCRVHKSPVNPMHSPLTFLLTIDFNIILLLKPASPKRFLSLGSHIKSTAYYFSKTAFGKYFMFEMCHVSSQCASTDCLQIRLAVVSHVSAVADYPPLRLFCVYGYPTLREVLFLHILQGRVSCTFFHIIIIIIIIIIIFLRGIYTYIPQTNYVPREYSVASILLLLFMVLISLVSVLNLLYCYISTFRNMCAVPNMVVFCSSLTSCFPGMLLTYFLNDFEIVPVTPTVIGITFVFTFNMRCISVVRSLYFRIFSASL